MAHKFKSAREATPDVPDVRLMRSLGSILSSQQRYPYRFQGSVFDFNKIG